MAQTSICVMAGSCVPDRPSSSVSFTVSDCQWGESRKRANEAEAGRRLKELFAKRGETATSGRAGGPARDTDSRMEKIL